MFGGKLVEVRCGIFARRTRVVRVWPESRLRSQARDHRALYDRSPLSSRYLSLDLSLDLVLVGPRTCLPTARGACEVLDEVARICNAVAIFAHLSTTQISYRPLTRTDWQQHRLGSPGRHWVKRFYDGYPDHDVHRYLCLD
jgi:hypothetical protein